ncbi:hypothetical protein R1sor_026027 [Riccia sorocarpa]|uniref:Uncharacterized protein n=1 Tax=Riccia sorocarpa TaxID=122646 RepID=A0ABD3GCA9_9MARC
MSKFQDSSLMEDISQIVTEAKEKNRKFTETVEMQMGLKSHDPQKDKCFSGSVRLPHIPRPKMNVCMLGEGQHFEKAQEMGPARKVPIETVTVDISETTSLNFSPSSVPLSGKVTLRRLDPGDLDFSRYTWGAGSSITTDAMAAERWPLLSDLKMEIDLHNEPGLVSWVVDYFKRGRNSPQEIVLRIKDAEVVGKETKAKDLGVVCFTRPNEAGLEIWFEVLKNKQIKRIILPMATWEHDDLLPKGKGGVLDFSDDIGTNDKYSDAISTLRFYLLAEKKSQSSM